MRIPSSSGRKMKRFKIGRFYLWNNHLIQVIRLIDEAGLVIALLNSPSQGSALYYVDIRQLGFGRKGLDVYYRAVYESDFPEQSHLILRVGIG